MDREYRVGEIFVYEGKVLQCVKDFIEVEELKDGMLFRAENGKLYRFSPDVIPGEDCSCMDSGCSCTKILEQIKALTGYNEGFRVPGPGASAWFRPVDESKESKDNSESGVRRHIDIAVDAVEGENVRFHIVEQTHRGPRFCERGPEFRAKNGFLLCSGGFPQVDVKANALFVWGPHVGDGNLAVFARVGLFAKIMEAVTEYNLTNGKGYEKHWPQKGDQYYFVTSSGRIDSYLFAEDQGDKNFQSFGNFFRTREEAEAARKRVRKALREK